MSTSPTTPVPPGTVPAPSVAYEPEVRSTFGWRAGSIRGILSLMVLGLLWSVVLFSPELRRDQQIPLIYVYLQFLLVLIIAYYFPPHGSTASLPQERRGIRLWPEIVPWVLLVGSIGLGVWLVRYHHEFAFPPSASFTLPLMLLGGFFIGHALTWLVSRLSGGRLPPWFQDFQAWIALLGMVGLATVLLIHVFIMDGLEVEQRESLRTWLTPGEGVLAGLVSFYFGARTEPPRVLVAGAA